MWTSPTRKLPDKKPPSTPRGKPKTQYECTAAYPISVLLTSVGIAFRKALILKESTRNVEKLSVNSDVTTRQ
jgi:hypothetical protein